MLGDTPGRDYANKLRAFERFAAPELERAVADLDIDALSTVLDLGCGAGVITSMLAARAGQVVALDLAVSHAQCAATEAPLARVLVADGRHLPLADGSVDLVWSCNALHHMGDAALGLRSMQRVLRPGGRVVIAQSHLMAELFFAWDYHLDARVRGACHAYYRDRYGLEERDTGGVTRLFGAMVDAGLKDVRPRTYVIERTAPLSEADRSFLAGVFEGYWGAKIDPYLRPEDREHLRALCDPRSPDYCLERPDFHHVQTLTVVSGSAPGTRTTSAPSPALA